MENNAAARKAPSEKARMASEIETAEYIGDLLSQLERLARSSGLVKLQYLLRSCQEEARRAAAGE